jgi:hypothetical protein
MKVLNRVGGGFLLFGIAVAAIIGFQSPTGRQFWDGVWQAVATILGYLRTQILRLNGSSIDGNGPRAVGITAAALVLILILLPKPISVRSFTILLLAASAAAFVLWDPSIVG